MIKALNLGSGEDVKKSDDKTHWDNLDIVEHNGANIICDLNKFPYPIKDNTYDYIYSNHVLEHLKEPKQTMNEMVRMCKHNGIIEINVPHFNNEGAFCLEHINFWNPVSFIHYAQPIGWEEQRNFKIKILKLKCKPSSLGKWIYPRVLRRKISLLLRGVYMEIQCKYQVIKQ